MTFGISPYSSNNSNSNGKIFGTGIAAGVAGMTAYYLPVTKDRFVREAYNIVKEDTEDQLKLFNEVAEAKLSGKLRTEHKLLLTQHGIADDLTAINDKISELRKNILDSTVVKNIKQGFADNFNDYKTSEALMDVTASKAFRNIKWRNFAWGTGIAFVLGCVFGANSGNSQRPPQA